jgi:tetratricopeptide (TPR) repeat protein
MVSDLIARSSQITTEIVTRAETEMTQASQQSPPVESDAGQALKVSEESRGKEQPSLIEAVEKLDSAVSARDLEAAREAFEEFLKSIDPSDKNRRLTWQVIYNARTYRIGREESLSELLRLQEENPDVPLPSSAIAHAFEGFEQYDQAANYYLAASRIPQENGAAYLVRAVECLRKAKKLDEAKGHLDNLLRGGVPLQSATRIRALKELYTVSNDLGQAEFAFSIGELVLLENPGDSAFRFSLAYDYLQPYPKLGLYHYELICAQQADDPVSLNNLGSAYETCGLPIHAVERYKRCVEFKHPLGTRNLAYRFLEAGLAGDAADLLRNTTGWDDPEGIIPQGLAFIHKRAAAEEPVREAAIDSIREHREFLGAMGAALLLTGQLNVDGTWRFPFGSMELKYDGVKLIGSGQQAVSPNSLRMALYPYSGTSGDSSPVIERFSLVGSFTGLVCSFSLSSKLSPERFFVPPPEEDRNGFLIFESGGGAGRVAEYKNGKPTSFNRIKRTA